jgi:hypothetical protein
VRPRYRPVRRQVYQKRQGQGTVCIRLSARRRFFKASERDIIANIMGYGTGVFGFGGYGRYLMKKPVFLI